MTTLKKKDNCTLINSWNDSHEEQHQGQWYCVEKPKLKFVSDTVRAIYIVCLSKFYL